MSFSVSFGRLNDLGAVSSDAFHALDDGADIREITAALIRDISNEAVQVFGFDRITVEQKWLQISWDLRQPVSLFFNAGIHSATGELVYNPLFLAAVVNRFGKEALLGVLCHEVGHRMVYRLWTQRGIRLSSWANEYCADYIAGLLTRLAQCSEKNMEAFYTQLCARESQSHPGGKYRAIVFKKGYFMIDHDSKTVFLRNRLFAPHIDTRHIFTDDFMRQKLQADVLNCMG